MKNTGYPGSTVKFRKFWLIVKELSPLSHIVPKKISFLQANEYVSGVRVNLKEAVHMDDPTLVELNQTDAGAVRVVKF